MEDSVASMVTAQYHGYARGTMGNYEKHLALWGEFCAYLHTPFNEAQADKISAFMVWLHDAKRVSGALAEAYTSGVKACFDLL